MAEVHRSRMGILQQRESAPRAQPEGVARQAGPSARLESLVHSAAALGDVVIRLLAAILIRPVAVAGRLLLGSQSNRVSGYGRDGYPEMDHWMAGRRHRLDK